MYVKFFHVRKTVRTKVFAGFAIFPFFHVSKMLNLCSRLLFHQYLLINRLLTSVFVLVNGIVFNRIKIACLMK